jgi:predicted metal-binding protein
MTRATLMVCTTCRAGRSLAEDETPPGTLLYDALAGLIEAGHDAPVTLAEVACLACCERGCACAIAMPGKWTYLVGGLSTELAPDLLAYAAAYVASRNGAVLPSRRPAALQNAMLARVPDLDSLAPEPGA